MEMKWEKLKWKYCYVKHKISRSRRLWRRSAKLNEITITKTGKNRNQVEMYSSCVCLIGAVAGRDWQLCSAELAVSTAQRPHIDTRVYR